MHAPSPRLLKPLSKTPRPWRGGEHPLQLLAATLAAALLVVLLTGAILHGLGDQASHVAFVLPS